MVEPSTHDNAGATTADNVPVIDNGTIVCTSPEALSPLQDKPTSVASSSLLLSSSPEQSGSFLEASEGVTTPHSQ